MQIYSKTYFMETSKKERITRAFEGYTPFCKKLSKIGGMRYKEWKDNNHCYIEAKPRFLHPVVGVFIIFMLIFYVTQLEFWKEKGILKRLFREFCWW